MHRQRREEINNLAENIRQTLNLQTPINIREVIQRLGGHIEAVEVIDNNPEIDARIIRNNDEMFTIQIQENSFQRRENFSLAHEVGHLFVHMGYLINDNLWNNLEDGQYMDRFGYSEDEYEANEFAGAFLMPREEFERIAMQNRNGDFFDVEAIANHFNVSKETVKVRGAFLELFSWS